MGGHEQNFAILRYGIEGCMQGWLGAVEETRRHWYARSLGDRRGEAMDRVMAAVVGRPA
ncbi:hypothetical protein [Micromonospora sp. NPDC093277]|uniref:hypothetical protein n=1 Tax=Micromonospora sp. NPDC093277 TaxID=3364291 RepID=UPI00382EE111